MELTQVISELENYTGKFPREALETAIEKKEEITPLLLANLAEWKDKLQELQELPDYFLHIYALFLLAQFKETKAYPLIIEFFSTPDNIILDVTGEVVTEHLGRILASVCDSDIEPIKQLIENEQVNEYVRSAGLDALMVLVANSLLQRESVIDYFKQLFPKLLTEKSNSEDNSNCILPDLVICSSKLYPEELQEYINQAFSSGLIDPFFVCEEDLDYYQRRGKERCLHELRESYYSRLVEDSIVEIEEGFYFPTINIKREDFKSSPPKKINKSQKKSKTRKNMQKQSRKKNRSKKK